MTIGTYCRPSICGCGFPLLRNSVPIGTEYVCLNVVVDGFFMTCGGCGKKFPVVCVFARRKDKPDSEGGYMPADCLDFNEHPPLESAFNPLG